MTGIFQRDLELFDALANCLPLLDIFPLKLSTQIIAPNGKIDEIHVIEWFIRTSGTRDQETKRPRDQETKRPRDQQISHSRRFDHPY
ncbi:hypothetical protein EAE99_008092 [Botrytis elliptica]|nr:hypothetical protein EAE99_008092 [Botrytis elliptica]